MRKLITTLVVLVALAVPSRALALNPSTNTGFTQTACGAGPPTGVPTFDPSPDAINTYFDTTGKVLYFFQVGTQTWVPSGNPAGVVFTITGTAHEILPATSSTGNVVLSTPQGIDTTSSPTFSSLTLSNPLLVPSGGTGLASVTSYSLLYGGGTNALNSVGVPGANQILGVLGGAPAWVSTCMVVGTGSEVIVTNGVGVLTLSTPQPIDVVSSPTFAGLTLSAPLSAVNGGTGWGAYTTGDLLYASSSTVISRLPGVATGRVLSSGGVGVAPAWATLSSQAVTNLQGTANQIAVSSATGVSVVSITSPVITPGAVVSTGDVDPLTDSIYNLGATTAAWGTAYVNTITTLNSTGSGVAGISMLIQPGYGSTTNGKNGGNLTLQSGAGNPSGGRPGFILIQVPDAGVGFAGANLTFGSGNASQDPSLGTGNAGNTTITTGKSGTTNGGLGGKLKLAPGGGTLTGGILEIDGSPGTLRTDAGNTNFSGDAGPINIIMGAPNGVATRLANAANLNITLAGGINGGANSTIQVTGPSSVINFPTDGGVTWNADAGIWRLGLSSLSIGSATSGTYTGQLTCGNIVTNGTVGFGATTTADTILQRLGAGTLADVNGVNSQTFCVYGDFTSSTNYSRLNIDWGSGISQNAQCQIYTSVGSTARAPRQLILGSYDLMSDTGCGSMLVKGASAYSQATVNTGGFNLNINAGTGVRYFTILTATNLSGAVFTVVMNQNVINFTDGTDFTHSGVNNTEASNLAGAVNANSTLQGTMVATAVANVVYLQLTPICISCEVHTNAAGGDATATQGANGNLGIYGNITLNDGQYSSQDFILGTATGTRIGTTTSQLLGFFGQAPVANSLTMPSTTLIQWNGDTKIARSGTAIGGISDGSTAAAWRVFNTTDSATSPTNSEFGISEWSSNVYFIGTGKTGTGSVRNVNIEIGGSTKYNISGTDFNPQTDNVNTLGDSSHGWTTLFLDSGVSSIASFTRTDAIGTQAAISGGNTGYTLTGTFKDGAAPGSGNQVLFNPQMTLNYTASPISGATETVDMISAQLIETSKPNGTVNILNLKAGASGTTSEFSVNDVGNVFLINSGAYRWVGRSIIQSPADGVLDFLNTSANAFTRLDFGGTTSSFVALQTSGTTITVGTADGGVAAGSMTIMGGLGVGNSATASANQIIQFDSGGNARTSIAQGVECGSAGTLGFSSTTVSSGSQDTQLVRDGAPDTLAMQRGTHQEIFNVYGTWTSTTSYERFEIVTGNGAATTIGTNQGSGGGSARALVLEAGGTTCFTCNTSGSVTAAGSLACVGLTASGSANCGTGNYWGWTNRTELLAAADGSMAVENNANTNTCIAFSTAAGIATYKNTATAGWGVSVVQAAAITSQTAGGATICTYTVGAANGVFEVSGHMNVASATAISKSFDVVYTDVGTGAQTTIVVPTIGAAGGFLTNGLIITTGDYPTTTLAIHAQKNTTITFETVGTGNTVVSSCAGQILQVQ